MTKFTAQKLGDLLTKAHSVSRKARGVLYVVHVEADDGSWCELDADSQDHAKTLARNWVDKLGARGCSCWEVRESGNVRIAPFFMYFWQPKEDSAS